MNINKRLQLYRFAVIIAVYLLSGFTATAQKGWTQLFNGKDLTGWDTWLRPPDMVGYVDSTHSESIGLNKDPLHIFTINNGILRITGEVWGAITSKKSYSNYHLRFETKWGDLKYYPKDTALRDAGLLFHCTGPLDFAFKAWMKSVEFQIEESNIGDYYDVSGGKPEIPVSEGRSPLNEKVEQYDALAPLKREGLWRVHRSGNFESPHGEWTRSELVARHADAVFIVNGFVVNRLYNIFREDIKRQSTGGKLQFQSEGAEHFFRRIDIRPLKFVSNAPVLTSNDSIIHVSYTPQNIDITNTGDAVEIIAVELMGKNGDRFIVKLPEFPMVLKKNRQLTLPVSLKPGSKVSNDVFLRLETVSGPIEHCTVRLVPQQ